MSRPATRPSMCLWVLLAVVKGTAGQDQQTPPNQHQEENTRDTPATFRTKVNLGRVPVVVRDRKGHAVGLLVKEDYQLFDRGKPQTISSFSVETLAGQAAVAVKSGTAPAFSGEEAQPPAN